MEDAVKNFLQRIMMWMLDISFFWREELESLNGESFAPGQVPEQKCNPIVWIRSWLRQTARVLSTFEFDEIWFMSFTIESFDRWTPWIGTDALSLILRFQSKTFQIMLEFIMVLYWFLIWNALLEVGCLADLMMGPDNEFFSLILSVDQVS